MAAVGDEIWVTDRYGTITRLDGRTGDGTGTTDAGYGPGSLTVTDTSVWVTFDYRFVIALRRS